MSVIFDGSTRQGEAIAIIVRFVDDDWVITQRLIRIDICSKSGNSEELTRVLNEALCMEEYGIRASALLAAMRDGASVNQAALNRIRFMFPELFNVVCFSHTLDNVGNHIVIPTLLEFGNLWIRLFSHSHKSKVSMERPNWTGPQNVQRNAVVVEVEVYKQLLEQFGDVSRFLQQAEADKIGPNIVSQLQAILSEPQRLKPQARVGCDR